MESLVYPNEHMTCHYFTAWVHQVQTPEDLHETISFLRSDLKLFPDIHYAEHDIEIHVFQGYSITPIDLDYITQAFARTLRRHISITTEVIVIETC